MRSLTLLAVGTLALGAAARAAEDAAQRLDVPLTVEERAGVKREGEPVASGVPLPRGLVIVRRGVEMLLTAP